ncbi:IclR family transcriptional regulator [Microbacterium sp.]|uniref:IclR family transcriptional regulator n=1 Tax=Microbacterium sp. TaxID=51671 RepID=UPI0037C57860
MQIFTDPERPVPQYPIESVDRALRLLKLFKDHGELRLADARDALGVGQSTAHRLMAMLQYHGFVDQDAVSRMYLAGPALLEVGLAAVQNLNLRAVAQPILQQLADESGETVHLGVLMGTEVLFMDAIESEAALRVSVRIGRQIPAHATSLGKAMLAALPQERVEHLYPDDDLIAVTERTITKRADLFDVLDRVREQGYAENLEEGEPGVGSIAVAVRDGGTLIGGLSIAAPRSRIRKAERDRFAALLIDAAAELVTALHAGAQ